MDRKYIVLSIDSTDPLNDNDREVLFVEGRYHHFDQKKAKAKYDKAKDKYSNVYLVEIIEQEEHI